MKTIGVAQTGKLGDVVASRNRYGPFQCKRVPRQHPGTAAQRAVWGDMADWSWNWNHLTEEQRVRWRRLAEMVRSRLRLGESHRLEGRLLFIKLNRVLATCERRPLFDPPSLPQFGRNPVTGFEIREAKGKTVFKLKVS